MTLRSPCGFHLQTHLGTTYCTVGTQPAFLSGRSFNSCKVIVLRTFNLFVDVPGHSGADYLVLVLLRFPFTHIRTLIGTHVLIHPYIISGLQSLYWMTFGKLVVN